MKMLVLLQRFFNSSDTPTPPASGWKVNNSCFGSGHTPPTLSAITPLTLIEYSKDGTNFQLENTFPNLIATTYTITARNANLTSCAATEEVTIQPGVDNEDPVADCPDDISQNVDPGKCTANVDLSGASPTDNCEGVFQVFSKGTVDSYPIGTTEVTATATDGSGNTDQCTFNVTIIDNENPVAFCPDNMNVSADRGNCSAYVDLGEGMPMDNCSGATQEYSPGSGIFDVGITQVTATATDAAGNTDECTFNVIVSDNEDPVADCPPDVFVNVDEGSCGAEITFQEGNPTDNCNYVNSKTIFRYLAFSL